MVAQVFHRSATQRMPATYTSVLPRYKINFVDSLYRKHISEFTCLGPEGLTWACRGKVVQSPHTSTRACSFSARTLTINEYLQESFRHIPLHVKLSIKWCYDKILASTYRLSLVGLDGPPTQSISGMGAREAAIFNIKNVKSAALVGYFGRSSNVALIVAQYSTLLFPIIQLFFIDRVTKHSQLFISKRFLLRSLYVPIELN